MLIANIIWPTFMTPYVLWYLLPFLGPLIFGIEIFLGMIILRKEESKKQVARVVFLANLFSSAAGVLAGMLLSLIPGEANDPESVFGGIYMFLSYFVAFILSVIIEALVMSRMFKRNAWMLSLILNCASYGALLVLFLSFYLFA